MEASKNKHLQYYIYIKRKYIRGEQNNAKPKEPHGSVQCNIRWSKE